MPTISFGEYTRREPKRCKHCHKRLHSKPLYCTSICQSKYRAGKG